MTSYPTPQLDRDADVVIVGAGPVGTLLAAELALGGVRPLVLERDREPATTIKAGGINLASAELLARRGLIDAARSVHERSLDRAAALLGGGDPTDRERMRERLRARPPRAAHFAGMMLTGELAGDDPDVAAHAVALDGTMVAQRELQEMLDGHAARLGVVMRRGVTVTGLQDDGDRVRVETDQGTVTAPWVVGCDGGRSVVRHLADFAFPGSDPEITGRQARVEFAAGDEERLAPGWHWTPRGVYRRGPGPGTVLTVEFDGPPADRETPVSAGEVEDSLRRVTATDVSITGLAGEATRWTDNARQATAYRRGRVLLAGDAAHVHPPFSGQGLNLGLGDAANLGWKLAATIAGRAPDGLLDTYTAERHPIGAWVLEWTRAQVALMRPDEKTGALRDVVRGMLDTPGGLTRVVNLCSGVMQQVELGGDHPLVGRLVPDLTGPDGRPLNEAFAAGGFVLLDRTPDGRLAAAVAGERSRLTIVHDPAGGDDELAGLLARPDGVVAWAATGDASSSALRGALRRWAGSPIVAQAPGDRVSRAA